MGRGLHPAALAILMTALLVVSCAELIQREELVTVQTVAPSAHACGECHVTIHEEWMASAHAAAFTDETFQRATLGARTQACLGCHVPESVLRTAGEPTPRTHLREEGVTCIVCHLNPESQAMAGPLRSMGPVVPHAVEEGDARFLSSALCATCHVGTGREVAAGAAVVGDSRTCQECHMPEVVRRTTQATDLMSAGIVALHDTHTARSHTFELGAIADFPGAVAIDVSAGDRITVQATNRLPHPIPTGDFGHREVLLTAQLFDADQRVVAEDARRFANREGAGWASGASETLALDTLPGGTSGTLRVEVMRLADEAHTPVSLARSDFLIRGQTMTPLPAEETSSP